jgi:hypothetical protein
MNTNEETDGYVWANISGHTILVPDYSYNKNAGYTAPKRKWDRPGQKIGRLSIHQRRCLMNQAARNIRGTS